MKIYDSIQRHLFVSGLFCSASQISFFSVCKLPTTLFFVIINWEI